MGFGAHCTKSHGCEHAPWPRLPGDRWRWNTSSRRTLSGRRRLLQAVWGPEHGDETDSLRVAINQLRKKLELDPARPRFILTEPWVGYRFEANEKTSGQKQVPN